MQSFPYIVLSALLIIGATTGAPATAAAQQAPASFEALLARPLELRPERHGQRPRLFFGPDDLRRIRETATRNPDAWRAFVEQARALTTPPPPPSSAQDRGLLYDVGFALPEPAFAFAVTREPRFLAQARTWIDTILAYEPWGYVYSKPDQDIPAAHLLYGLATAYDLLHDDLTAGERLRIRTKLVAKTRRLYEAYVPKPKRRYSHSQNHTFINAAAIGLAALALDADSDETKRWLSFARAVFDRTIETYARDGYYYEGYHYFEFSVPWIVHMLDAFEHNTTERLYDRIRLDLSKYYVAHSLLPGRASTSRRAGSFFDFGDAGRGATDRLAGTPDLLGAHPILYRLAERYRDPESRVVADWASALVARSREPMWTFIWRHTGGPAPPSPRLRSTSFVGQARRRRVRPTDDHTPDIPLVHHFKDADVVFARTSWGDDATAVAFKCGPPEGHRAAALLKTLPDWRQSTGHAHPDAGSFIVFARGDYITGDAGYTGVKMTRDHNTLLVAGRGQSNDGRHEVFAGVPPDRLDAIRLTDVRVTERGFQAACDGTSAYDPALGLEGWQRTFSFDGDAIEIADTVQTRTPLSATVLLHSDRRIQSWAEALASDPRTSPEPKLKLRPTSTKHFALAAQHGHVKVTIDPSGLDARIERHYVTTQGRPGSVEKGEREQRGFVLGLTTRPAVRTHTRMRLDIIKGTSSSPEKP